MSQYPLSKRSLERLHELVIEANELVMSVRQYGPPEVRYQAHDLLSKVRDLDEILSTLYEMCEECDPGRPA